MTSTFTRCNEHIPDARTLSQVNDFDDINAITAANRAAGVCLDCAQDVPFGHEYCAGDRCVEEECTPQLFPVGCEFHFFRYSDDSEEVLIQGDTVTVIGHSNGMVNVSYQSSTFPRENTTSVWPEELDPTCISCIDSIDDKHS
jgi:hypothetical protein